MSAADKIFWRIPDGGSITAPRHAFRKRDGSYRSLCGPYVVSKPFYPSTKVDRPEEAKRCPWCDARECQQAGRADPLPATV